MEVTPTLLRAIWYQQESSRAASEATGVSLGRFIEAATGELKGLKRGLGPANRAKVEKWLTSHPAQAREVNRIHRIVKESIKDPSGKMHLATGEALHRATKEQRNELIRAKTGKFAKYKKVSKAQNVLWRNLMTWLYHQNKNWVRDQWQGVAK
jgi:hypothetical protein